MRPVTFKEFSRAAERAFIAVEQFEGGTLRLDPKHVVAILQLRDMTGLDWIGKAAVRCYVCGREDRPPLREFADRKLGRERSVLALKKHRYLMLTSVKEIEAVVSASVKHGWCVDNDIYLFDANRGWMWYVGHDSLLVYLLQRPARAGARAS